MAAIDSAPLARTTTRLALIHAAFAIACGSQAAAAHPPPVDATLLALHSTPSFVSITPGTLALLAALAGLALVVLIVCGRRRRARRASREALQREAYATERTAECTQERATLAEAYERLSASHADVLRARDEFLHTLEQLRLGSLTIDGDGIVRDVSRTPQTLWGPRGADLHGLHWSQALSLGEDESHALRALLRSPAPRREKLPIHVGIRGRTYWMALTVVDEPRFAGGHTLYLHDVTETYVVPESEKRGGLGNLIGSSRAMQALYHGLQSVAAGDITVLIEGETGTGKELVAQAIHQHSPRRLKPFVTVNVATLTESLVASQLFGHRRGAFTGAVSDQLGLFQAADGGTLFLDEIGDIPVSIQLSLLRVLQEREVMRVGDSRPRHVDVRVIAATHRNLFEAVERGIFRQDLLYRIRVATLALPPLRERTDDIPLLVERFLASASRAPGAPPPTITQDAMTVLSRHAWPGNVRELKNVIDQAVLRAHDGLITREALSDELRERPTATPPDVMERERLLEVLSRAGGNRTEAAKILGVSRSTFYRRWQYWFGDRES